MLELSKSLFIEYFEFIQIFTILNLKLQSALSQNPEQRLGANEIQDIIKVKVNFAFCFRANIVDLFSVRYHDR